MPFKEGDLIYIFDSYWYVIEAPTKDNNYELKTKSVDGKMNMFYTEREIELLLNNKKNHYISVKEDNRE